MISDRAYLEQGHELAWLGTQSERGSRWVERICSVRETRRLQARSPT